MIRTCSDFLEALYDYSFKEMNAAELASFFEHAENCPECQKAYESVMLISKTLDKITAPRMIPIYQFKYPKKKESFNFLILSRIIAAAALFTFLVIFTLPKKDTIKNSDLIEVNKALYEVSLLSDPDILEKALYESKLLQSESLYYYQEDIYFLLNAIDVEEFSSLNNKLKKEFFLKISVGGIL